MSQWASTRHKKPKKTAQKIRCGSGVTERHRGARRATKYFKVLPRSHTKIINRYNLMGISCMCIKYVFVKSYQQVVLQTEHLEVVERRYQNVWCVCILGSLVTQKYYFFVHAVDFLYY
jgi:hypothetical protein